MRHMLVTTAAAALLAIATPAGALAQPEGKGRDRGEDRGPPGKSDRAGDRQDRGDRGNADRGRERDRGDARPDRNGPGAGRADRDRARQEAQRGVDRNADRGRPPAKAEVRRADRDRREWDRDRRNREGDRRADRDWQRPAKGKVDDRRARADRDRGGDRRVVWLRREPERRIIQGCPPGLARQNEWCLPPGQLRQIARARYERPRYDQIWRSYDRGWDSRYSDGYLYRYSPEGSLVGYAPVLGGALSLGSVWPGQYDWQPVPAYYGDYYGYGDRYDYRFADGVVYGVDSRTQAIQAVVALLTGQDWTVGQAMPAGYDVYNVPYGYRDRYADGPDRMYRYDDGYVYQVDPNTRLIQAAIQLLA